MARAGSKRLAAFVVGGFVTVALVVGALAVFSEVQAAPRCICPMVYSPVTCSNGKTYTNLCFANCAHATGCVPVFVVPPPI
jgi:hypothetical protein